MSIEPLPSSPDIIVNAYTGLSDKHYCSGLIIGHRSDDYGSHWGIALNSEKKFLTGGGFSIRTKEEGSDSVDYIQNSIPDNIRYFFMTRIDEYCGNSSKSSFVSIRNTFTVNQKQMEEIQIDSKERIEQLCCFAAHCYKSAPPIIQKMRDGDFTAFKKYQEAEAMVEAIAGNYPGRPIMIELKL